MGFPVLDCVAAPDKLELILDDDDETTGDEDSASEGGTCQRV